MAPRRKFTDETWAPHKDDMLRWYLIDGHNCRAIEGKLAEEHNFHVSNPTIRKRILDWGVSPECLEHGCLPNQHRCGATLVPSTPLQKNSITVKQLSDEETRDGSDGYVPETQCEPPSSDNITGGVNAMDIVEVPDSEEELDGGDEAMSGQYCGFPSRKRKREEEDQAASDDTDVVEIDFTEFYTATQLFASSTAPDLVAASLTELSPTDEVEEQADDTLSEYEPEPAASAEHTSIDDNTGALPHPDLPDIEDGHRVPQQALISGLASFRLLASYLLQEELNMSNTLNGACVETVSKLARLGLFSMGTPVIHALLRGDLPLRNATDARVNQIITENLRLQDPRNVVNTQHKGSVSTRPVQPVIYVQYLVDASHLGPNERELRILLARLKTYCAPELSASFTYKVDSAINGHRWQREWSNQGRRRYLSRDGGAAVAERLSAVEGFCAAVKTRLATDLHPERSPIREVGYTNAAYRRFQEHKSHSSSGNFLLCLIEAICAVEFNGRFRIAQFVVALLEDPAWAVVMEIMVTRLSSGYNTSGFGTSFWHAGRSNNSAIAFTSQDYEDFKEISITRGIYDHNYAWEDAQIDAEMERTRQAQDDYISLKNHRAFLCEFSKEVNEEERERRELITDCNHLTMRLAWYRGLRSALEVRSDYLETDED